MGNSLCSSATSERADRHEARYGAPLDTPFRCEPGVCTSSRTLQLITRPRTRPPLSGTETGGCGRHPEPSAGGTDGVPLLLSSACTNAPGRPLLESSGTQCGDWVPRILNPESFEPNPRHVPPSSHIHAHSSLDPLTPRPLAPTNPMPTRVGEQRKHPPDAEKLRAGGCGDMHDGLSPPSWLRGSVATWLPRKSLISYPRGNEHLETLPAAGARGAPLPVDGRRGLRLGGTATLFSTVRLGGTATLFSTGRDSHPFWGRWHRWCATALEQCMLECSRAVTA